VVHLIRILSRSHEETRDLGKKLGSVLSSGDVIALTGDLGSGKSVLARGVLEALGVKGDMPSPSFVIVASYKAARPVNHIDLYRLEDAGQALDIGIEDLLYSDCVSIVEWADRLGGFLPPGSIMVGLETTGDPEHRLISIETAAREVKARLVGLAASLVRLDGQ
jgi:tRNA threonylcarbamoyladenosine biosynthesis protein TsaE